MDGVVLVMDYSAYERQRIRQIIDKIGHLNVVEVGDISQFLLMNSNIEGLKLVVLDLSFPTENDGFFVLKRIRTSSSVNVPIIVLSQSDRQELKVEALKYSVNDYIVKPYNIKRLDDSIRVFTNAEKAFHYNTENISDISMSFDNYVDREIKYSKRTGAPFSLILITTLQINAKEVSDSATIEPISGDDKASILAMAARKASEALRATDTMVLNNNRDVIIVLPCTDEAGASLVSEKIKAGMESEFKRMNTSPHGYIYPVHTTFPSDGENFQELMQKAFKKISDKEMLERIVSIPSDTRKYADKSYNKFRRWF